MPREVPQAQTKFPEELRLKACLRARERVAPTVLATPDLGVRFSRVEPKKLGRSDMNPLPYNLALSYFCLASSKRLTTQLGCLSAPQLLQSFERREGAAPPTPFFHVVHLTSQPSRLQRVFVSETSSHGSVSCQPPTIWRGSTSRALSGGHVLATPSHSHSVSKMTEPRRSSLSLSFSLFSF